MLQPSRTKYRKAFRGRKHGLSQGFLVSFGDYGLKSLEASWITANQIESARRAIAHATKRNGKVWIRIFPDKPYTAKGANSMGAGKGDVKGYVCVVKPGRIMFEVSGLTEPQAREALLLASAKLPVTTKIIKRK
ncbi:MAG: 50S ribosomal protein L16 [Candidatus Shapirobacteria bacterium]|jgi:large subunit ribosomal protein L16